MKKQVLLIGISLALMIGIPIVVTGLCNLKWLILAVTSACFCAALVVWLVYNELIIATWRIVYGKIRNRIFGAAVADKVYPLISNEQQRRIENAVTISFTGDLILLREMVERAYDTDSGKYEFDRMFEHVSDIWQSCDLSIGVFEGPMCGEEHGYSTSNFDDGIDLHLNYPDSFAEAIKNAGMDLVTLANNHIFDMGIEPGLRTVEVLDRTGLDHIGLCIDKTDDYKPKIINVKGKRIGVLAYTYGQNGVSDDFFFSNSARHYLKPVVKVGSKYFKRNVEMVKEDFRRMKAMNPDLIIVLPHMGEQFRNKPDKTQLKWCDIFTGLGADIIFSDHAHHVQPIEWRKNKDGRDVLVVHCPGNFINSYTEHDGDASMIVRAYLDSETLEPFAVGVTPIYAHCPQNGQWTGLPTYKAYLDSKIYNSLSRADYRRINYVNRLVTGISLNTPLDLDSAQKEYISFADSGFVKELSPNSKIQQMCVEAPNDRL